MSIKQSHAQNLHLSFTRIFMGARQLVSFKIEADTSPAPLWSMERPALLSSEKTIQLQAYYGMLGGAPGTLGRSIFILGITVSLKHCGNPGKSRSTVREMDGEASKERYLEN